MPLAPPPSGRYLAFTDREQIALWRAQGHGVREIARRLARAPSTISRELRRNAATRAGGFEYRGTTAQWHADRAARRFRLVSGMDVHFGLFHGLEINIESLCSRVAGRIASATPADLNSPPARDGTLFLLPDKSEKEWLDGGPRCRSRRELG
jgi:hypothetical protein